MVTQTPHVVLPLAVVMVMLLAPASGFDTSRPERSLLEGDDIRDQHGHSHHHPSDQPLHQNTQHAQNRHGHQDDGESVPSSADGVVNHWLYRFPPWSESNPAPTGYHIKSQTKEAHDHTSDVVISSSNADGSHRTGRLESVKVLNTKFQTEVVKTILDSELSGLKQSPEPKLFTPSPSLGQNTFTPIQSILQPPTPNSGTTTALNSNKNIPLQHSNPKDFVTPPPKFDTVPLSFSVVDEGSTVIVIPEMQPFMPEDVFVPSNFPQNKPSPFLQTEFNSGTRQPKQVISVPKSLSKTSDFRPSPLISITNPSNLNHRDFVTPPPKFDTVPLSLSVDGVDYKISVTPYPLPEVPTHAPLPLYPHITNEIVNTPSNNIQTSSHPQTSYEKNINENLVQGVKRKKPSVTYHPKGSADTLWVPFIPGVPLPILLQQAQRFSQPAGTRQSRYIPNKKSALNNSGISRDSDNIGTYPKSIQDIIDSEFDTAEALFSRGPQSSQQKISVIANQNNDERWIWTR